MVKTKNPFTLLGTALIALSAILSVGLVILVIREPLSRNQSKDVEIVKSNSVAEDVEETEAVNQKTISILDEGQQISIETAARTVGQALLEADITIRFADRVNPPMGKWIIDDEQIAIDRANPFTILVDGQRLNIYSYYTKTIDILADAGISLIGFDTTIPGPNEKLKPGDLVEVVRVSEEIYFEEEPIPYGTVWQGTDKLMIDQKAQLNPGLPGKINREVRVRLENGVESERATNEWVSQEPVSEVMGYGTRIEIKTIDTPDGPLEYWRVVKMRVTAYTPSSAGKPPDHPGYGITASGVQAGKGVVAIDPKIVPFRSQVYVPGYGIGFAGDTGGGVKGRWIDLGFNDGEIESWHGYVDVYYLTPVPSPDKINFLLPDSLP
ncbi:MAG: 3D domain-containing protein [Anaerolineae bacterium]|nr:MAG: 3D domain-containing protein [Anaerolineae bacterium]